MTLTRYMIQFIYYDEENNNLEQIKQFAKEFDPDVKFGWDAEWNVLEVAGSDALFEQRVWHTDFLIFDSEGNKTFSIGVLDSERPAEILKAFAKAVYLNGHALEKLED